VNVTFVISSLEAGGAEKNLALLANAFSQNGHAVTILTWSDQSGVQGYPLDPAVRVKPLALVSRSESFLRRVQSVMHRLKVLRQAIAISKPDVCISFIDVTNVYTLAASFRLSVPVVVCERIEPAWWPPTLLWRLLRTVSYRQAQSIVVQTEPAKDQLARFLRRKTTVIPNPVIRPATPGAAPESSQLIVTVGRLEPQKRFDVLLHAVTALKDKHPDWRLLILGDGSQQLTLRALAHELGLSEMVLFEGRQRDLETYYQRAAVFVSSSDFEGFPNALAEAMATGVPVIATDTAGASALVRHGEDGFVVARGDVTALGNRLEFLAQNPAERRRLGDNARQVTDRFPLGDIVHRWERLIESAAHT
jgi:GalNAc-alpha-(1->4)-GalNAc-alpha-(1->3)-diNAcBac-PP-undecaprenol alpha-1,4-N-acetyl-D-galactosaminyltransferase